MNVRIGKKLRELRKQKGITQEQAAEYLCISQPAYARIENGITHSWSNHIPKICELFEIDPQELF